MKRIVSCLLMAIFMLNVMSQIGNAEENTAEIIVFEDGSYLTIEIIHDIIRASGNKTANKVHTYYDSANSAQWKTVLTGSFSYTGSSSSCTASSVSTTIYDSSWYVISERASKSGNTATASVTMGDKLAGVTVTRIPVHLSLSCDANGNLS